MSRKILFTLITAMILVMVGLIVVQTSLIMRASYIKEEQFSRSVTNALRDVINSLEGRENQLAQQRAQFGRPLNIRRSPQITGNRGQGNMNSEFSISLGITQQNYFSDYRKQLQFNDSDTLSSQEQSAGLNIKDFVSPFEGLNYMNLIKQELIEINLSRKLIVVEKMLLEERPVIERIDPAFLKESLSNGFKLLNIDLDYKYAVFSFDEGDAKLITGNDDYNINVKGQYTGLLFPSDINEINANYLHVYFPKQSGYILSDTGMLVIPLIFLTGLLIAIFIYTVLIILKQKKLSVIKNDFINNMTHELKTPISTISLASQMLEDGSINNTPKTISHISKVINQESKRLSFQVEKVLQMAVFNEGRLKLRFKELNLNELIKKVVGNYELKVKNKNGELISKLGADLDEIKGDEVHITNVIFNLLDNAVKYSNGKPNIIISTKNKKESVIVSVEDNGIGISKEYHSQIFERFYRVPTGNVHNVKGFGLGLSYVKKITDAHNIEIKIDSILNKGTKFSLIFPLNTK